MAVSIKLFRGAFGHVSVLKVASDFVTHAHPEAHIVVWVEGAAGEMTIGRETVRLGRQAGAAINSLQPHSHALSHDGAPGRFLAFYIDPGWASRRCGLSSDGQLFAAPTIPLDPWLHRAAVGLLRHLEDNDGIEEMAGYEIERFIDCLFDAADLRRHRQGRAAGQPALDFRVRKAIRLMQATMCERLSLDEVARSVGLSRPHFFALFKEQTDLTPNVYWNTLRMEEALRQLQESREPLIALSCNLGFTTPGNFSRFFRDHAGVSPTLYREAARDTAGTEPAPLS